MDNKVPETTTQKTELTYDEQLELVLKRFGGRKDILPARGDDHLLQVILGAIKTSPSPAACLQNLRRKFNAALSMAGEMSRYARDDHHHAFNLVEAMVKDKHFMLPGYDHPIDETRLVTVLVLDFDLLCAIARWMRVQPLESLESHMLPGVLDPLTADVRKRLPTLGSWSTTTSADLGASYKIEMVGRHSELLLRIQEWEKEGDDKAISVSRRKLYGLRNCTGLDSYTSLAYVINAPLDQVFGELITDRKVQDEVAAWQIRVPASLWDPLDIGFHPEAFHAKLKVGGVVKSLGLSHGYGAAWINRRPGITERYLRSMDVHPSDEIWLGLSRCDAGEQIPFALWLH